MYKLFDLIRAVRSALQPYTVVVWWEGDVMIHKAWTLRDAMEWSACYPVEANVGVMTRRGRFIGERVGYSK